MALSMQVPSTDYADELCHSRLNRRLLKFTSSEVPDVRL